jgi:hypothetical protein
MSNVQASQEIGKDLMLWTCFRDVALWVVRLDTHHPHQSSDPLPIDHIALCPEDVAQHPAARKGVVKV